jgi:coproporphyrinogen III oxidase-like Fe-S oxidoreductase
MTPADAREVWRAHEGVPRREGLNVHVHVPFCEAICTYCDCATDALGARDQIARYLDGLEQETAYFADVFQRPADRLYVGGGTPNLLSEPELERLLRSVQGAHRFAPDAIQCAEAHPLHSTRAKLQIAASLGINRVSLGVQSRDPRVLRRVNRAGQTDADVERAVRDAFDVGVREVNLDFIHGLADEPVASTLAGVVWALSLEPTTVCLQLLNDSTYAAPYRDRAHRERIALEFEELAGRIAEHVDALVPSYACTRRPDTVVVHRRDMPRELLSTPEYYSGRDATFMSTIGYGRYAQSTLRGRLFYQNQSRGGRFDPHATLYSGRRRSPELEALIVLVAELEHAGAVDLARLASIDGKPAVAELVPWIDRLVDGGHLARDGDRLLDRALSPEGVVWLAKRITPNELVPSTALGTIAITGRGVGFRIHFEEARPEGHYFAVAQGVGMFYREDAASPPAETIHRITTAAARHAAQLLADRCPARDVVARTAAFLGERLAALRLPVEVKVLADQPRPRRLTTVAS